MPLKPFRKYQRVNQISQKAYGNHGAKNEIDRHGYSQLVANKRVEDKKQK